MSYTILPYSAPYTQEAQDALNIQDAFLAQTNNFSVPQNFAGVVNSGSDSCASLAVSGNATIVGSFYAGPKTVSSLVISGAGSDAAAFTANSLAVTNASVFNGPISGTSASMSGLISGANGLTINSGAVSFPVQSQSGASVINNTLSALSIVDKSVGDAKLLLLVLVNHLY